MPSIHCYQKEVINKAYYKSEQSEQQIILPKIRLDKFAKWLRYIVNYKEKQRSVSMLVKCITDQNDQNNKSYFLKYTQTSSLNAFNLLLTTKKKKSLVKCITNQNRSEQPEQQIILPKICPEKFAKHYRSIVTKKRKKSLVNTSTD